MNDYEFIIFILVLVAWVVFLFRDSAKSYERGYRDGHAAADNWWISADREIDAARQQIWREEPKRGMEQ